MKKDFDAGKFKIQFVGASFLDGNLGGEGSKNGSAPSVPR